MGIKHSDFSRMIFNHIDELFAEEIGPVAPILCEESVNEWVKELKVQGERMSLKTIPLYVDKLAAYIEDQGNRKRFTEGVYEIDALKFYQSCSGGNK